MYISFQYQEFCSLKTYITGIQQQLIMQSVTKQKIQTGISHPQSVAAQKYKRTCVTVLNTLSHHRIIKIFVS